MSELLKYLYLLLLKKQFKVREVQEIQPNEYRVTIELAYKGFVSASSSFILTPKGIQTGTASYLPSILRDL